MNSPSRARVLLIIAALLFSTGGAAIKLCSLSAAQVACFRSGIAAAIILLVLPGARRGWTWRVWLVGLSYAATVLLFVMGNKMTTAAHTIFLQSTAPLYVLLLAPWLLREKLHKSDAAVMVLVLVGLLMLCSGMQEPSSTAPQPGRGNILAIISGVTWALTIVGLRWLRTIGAPADNAAISAAAAGNLMACAVCLPWVWPVTDSVPLDWGVLVFLGVFQIGVAYMCMTSGVAHVPALEASLILLIEPVMNPVWAWVVHREFPGWFAVAGGTLIVAATILKSLTGKQNIRI